MGFAIAAAAREQGADVTLVAGPTSLTTGIKTVSVTTAEEMYREVLRLSSQNDLIFMVAAVSDWRPASYKPQKIKNKKRWFLPLIPTKDILCTLGRRKREGQILVGFAAETEKLLKHGRGKLIDKKCDFLIVNRVGRPGTGLPGAGPPETGFESDTNEVILLSKEGAVLRLPRLSKKSLARRLFKEILKSSNFYQNDKVYRNERGLDGTTI